MADLTAVLPPLDASADDGMNQLSELCEVASDMWGDWAVNWPQGMANKPKLDDGRKQGYAARVSDHEPPRFARRYVRRDVQIDAREGGGWSNTEAQIDSVREELSGEVIFEKTIGPAGYGALVPGVDFKQGDLVPVLVWGKVLKLPVTAITTRIDEFGAPVVEVRVGAELIFHRSELAQANADMERQIRGEAEQLQAEMERRVKEEENARNRLARYVDKDYNPSFDYSPGAYRTGVLSTAETRAGQLAGQAESNAKSYTDAELQKKPWGAQVQDALTQARNAQNAASNAVSHANILNSNRMTQIDNVKGALERQLWREQQRIDQVQNTAIAANTAATTATSRATEAVAMAVAQEEKYRIRFGSWYGHQNTFFAPNDNPWVEVRNMYGNETVAKLKRNAEGWIFLIHKTKKGLMDMGGFNVNHYAGEQFKITGGAAESVESSLIMYSLWKPSWSYY